MQTLLGRLELERGRYGAAERAYRRRSRRARGSPGRSRGAGPRRGGAAATLGRAIARYREVVERLPLPEYAIALGEAEQAAGRRAAAARPTRWSEPRHGCCGARRQRRTSSSRSTRPTTATPRRRSRSGRSAWRRRAERSLGRRLLAGRFTAPGATGRARISRARRCGSAPATRYFLYHAGMIARRRRARPARRAELLGTLVAQAPRFSPLYGPARGAGARGPAMSGRRRDCCLARRRHGRRPAPARVASAHPLGNFTTNQLARSRISEREAQVGLRPRPGRDPELPARPALRRRRQTARSPAPSGRR